MGLMGFMGLMVWLSAAVKTGDPLSKPVTLYQNRQPSIKTGNSLSKLVTPAPFNKRRERRQIKSEILHMIGFSPETERHSIVFAALPALGPAGRRKSRVA